MRRFYMALSTYAAGGALVQAFAWAGYLPRWLPACWVAGVILVNAAFFVTLRRGWNMSLRDPSMTQLQLVVSMAAAMVLIFYADQARGALLVLLVVPMLFGAFRLSFRQMISIGALGVAGYAGMIVLSRQLHHDRLPLALELLHLACLAVTMLYVCIICSYMSRVREELAAAVTKIRVLAVRDPLTGLFNRRHLDETLTMEDARLERQLTGSVVLCVVDIDHFKKINDCYGHPVGDAVLAQVAKCIQGSVRAVDYVARYGGEEFVLLLEESEGASAQVTCERIRGQIAQLRLPGLPALSVTVSIGLASRTAAEPTSKLLARADQALYLAKARGRNRVAVATDVVVVAVEPSARFAVHG
ncbi:MAG: GGDEF domain-containing protein [Rhodanobacter sp.]